MDVLKLEAKVKEKFPNLSQQEVIMYMDGYMDGWIEGITNERARVIKMMQGEAYGYNK